MMTNKKRKHDENNSKIFNILLNKQLLSHVCQFTTPIDDYSLYLTHPALVSCFNYSDLELDIWDFFASIETCLFCYKEHKYNVRRRDVYSPYCHKNCIPKVQNWEVHDIGYNNVDRISSINHGVIFRGKRIDHLFERGRSLRQYYNKYHNGSVTARNLNYEFNNEINIVIDAVNNRLNRVTFLNKNDNKEMVSLFSKRISLRDTFVKLYDLGGMDMFEMNSAYMNFKKMCYKFIDSLKELYSCWYEQNQFDKKMFFFEIQMIAYEAKCSNIVEFAMKRNFLTCPNLFFTNIVKPVFTNNNKRYCRTSCKSLVLNLLYLFEDMRSWVFRLSRKDKYLYGCYIYKNYIIPRLENYKDKIGFSEYHEMKTLLIQDVITVMRLRSNILRQALFNIEYGKLFKENYVIEVIKNGTN